MDEADEAALMDAKFDEARAWPDDFCCDGLDDYDAVPSRTLTFYRRDLADLDKFPVCVEVWLLGSAEVSRRYFVFHCDGSEHHECPDRLSAIAKYDATLGTGEGWTSSISSQAQVAPPSEP